MFDLLFSIMYSPVEHGFLYQNLFLNSKSVLPHIPFIGKRMACAKQCESPEDYNTKT